MSVFTGKYLTILVSNSIINYVCDFKSKHICINESRILRGDLIEKKIYSNVFCRNVAICFVWLPTDR